MRLLPFCLALLPIGAFADILPVTAPPSAVTIYAQGAIVTRTTTLDLPAGRHTLRLGDMDPDLELEFIDVTLDGASLVTRTWHPDGIGPYRAPRTAEWQAARERLDQAQDALSTHMDAIARAQARGQAAQDQIDFLNDISLPEQSAMDVDALRAIGQLIASDGTAARAAITQAQAEIRVLSRLTTDLQFDVDTAQAALDAVTPSNDAPATLDLAVNVPEAGQGTLTLRYAAYAQWMPFYDVTLTDQDQLHIERSAIVRQFSNEDWRDVALTLSTLDLSERTEPGTLPSLLRRIVDPETQVKRGVELRSTMATADMAAPVIEAPAIVVEEAAAAMADFSGVGVSYALPGSTTLLADDSAVSLALDTLRFDATLSARAVPRRDDTAYRQVRFTNSSPEILIPARAIFYIGDQPIGESTLPLMPPNAEEDMFFGAIEGLRLKRIVLDRNEGDRGLISRSNQQSEATRLEIENLTNRSWDVELREAVPFSEQEDLEISWSATPSPTAQMVDDRRGILAWEIEIAPGETRQIMIETDMSWPEGQMLR